MPAKHPTKSKRAQKRSTASVKTVEKAKEAGSRPLKAKPSPFTPNIPMTEPKSGATLVSPPASPKGPKKNTRKRPRRTEGDASPTIPAASPPKRAGPPQSYQCSPNVQGILDRFKDVSELRPGSLSPTKGSNEDSKLSRKRQKLTTSSETLVDTLHSGLPKTPLSIFSDGVDTQNETFDDLFAAAMRDPSASGSSRESSTESEEGVHIGSEDEAATQNSLTDTRLPDGVHIGDSCYAKYKTCFFPAILRDFVPAQAPSHGKRKRQDDARYKVHVCGEEYDPSKLFARKDVIFIVDGKRFASCKVGHLDEVDDRQNAEFELLVREQTPSSMTDPTPFASPDEFEPLLRVKQLILLRPHLHAIIQEDFKPARQRIDGFFEKASNSRASMADVRFGDIRAEEITEIIMPELERWALRGDRWESIQPAPDASSEPPRPIGSDRYELLSTKERRNFVTQVLLPEVIIELCRRSSPDIAQLEEEEAYIAAQAQLGRLSEEDTGKDWVARIAELNNARKRLRAEFKMRAEVELDHERVRAEVRAGKGEMTERYKRLKRYRVFYSPD